VEQQHVAGLQIARGKIRHEAFLRAKVDKSARSGHVRFHDARKNLSQGAEVPLDRSCPSVKKYDEVLDAARSGNLVLVAMLLSEEVEAEPSLISFKCAPETL
jgi:hypothetical protein